jgi:hypothetical protein
VDDLEDSLDLLFDNRIGGDEGDARITELVEKPKDIDAFS